MPKPSAKSRIARVPAIGDPPLIAEIARLAAQAPEAGLPALLARIAEAAAVVSGSDAAAIYLVDPGLNEMHAAARHGGPSIGWPYVMPVGPPPAGADAARPPLGDWGQLHELADSRLAFPLASGGSRLGLLYVAAPNGPAAVDASRMAQLSTLASLAAMAVERRNRQSNTDRLWEWHDSFLSVLDASRTLRTAEDVPHLLQKIVKGALDNSGADLVVLYEHFEERKDVRIPPVVAGELRRQDVLSGKGLVVTHRSSAVFRMLDRREPFYADRAPADWIRQKLIEADAANDGFSFFRREGIRSSAGVVLRIDEERVGVLFLNYRKEFTFTPEFRRHFEFFAKQSALAIGNARFFVRSTQFSTKLEILNEIGISLGSARSLDASELGGMIERQAKRVIEHPNFEHPNFFMCLYDGATDRLTLQHLVDQFDNEAKITPGLQNGLAAYVCRTGKTLLADRAAQQRLFDEGKAKLVGERSAVWLGAPMKARGKVLGVIVVQDYHNELAITREHKYLLTSIASQAAGAIDKLVLLDEKTRKVEELSALLDLSRAFGAGTLPLGDVLTDLLDKICELAYCDGCVLYLLKSGGCLEIYATSTRLRGRRKWSLKVGQAVTGIVAAKRAPMIENSYETWAGRVDFLDDTEAGRLKHVCAAPLLLSGKVLGVVTLSSTRERNFTGADVELLERFASSAALAIQSARDSVFRDALIHGGPTAIVAIDPRGSITEFNEAAGKILGYERAEILGKNVVKLYWEGVAGGKRIAGLLRRDGRVHREISARGKRDEKIPIALSAALLRGSDKEVLGSVGMVEDLRLAALRSRIHPIFEAIDEINRSADLKSILDAVVLNAAEFLDAAAACIFLKEGEDFVLRAPYGCDPESLPELSSPPVQRRLAALGDSGRIETLELPDRDAPALRLLPGSRSAVVAPIQAKDRLLGLLLVEQREDSLLTADRDVLLVLTSHAAQVAAAVTRIDLLNEREATLKGMVVAANATTIGQIATSFVHEVGNALHLMSVSILGLRRELGAATAPLNKQGYEKRLTSLQSEIERVDSLARRLQRFTRQGLKAEKGDAYLNEIVGKTLDLLAGELKVKRLRPEQRLDSSLDRPPGERRGNPVYVDEQQIQQVLMNLVLNAAAASPDHGRLVIETHHHADRGVVELRVTDQGPGVPEEERRKIFEPFYTTKESGIGLGLFITRLLVEENHGGAIEISRGGGKGATFAVVLPKRHEAKGERA
jgi:PAS domain S-box-containing protein